MPRPNKNYEPKKEALIQTALDLFIQYGYENVTISQIMRALGLTKTGMYHYFSSKEEILDAAISYGISQNIERIKEEISTLPVEKKMIVFTLGTSFQNSTLQKLLYYKNQFINSYATYRIRERFIHENIPVMEEIICEGISRGIYKSDHPRQAAEFIVLLAKTLAEINMLPYADSENMKLRILTFLQVAETLLHPSKEHIAEMKLLFEQELLKMVGETEKDASN